MPRALCLGMPGQDRNKNQCFFCNVILGRVTLSPTGLHLLHCSPLAVTLTAASGAPSYEITSHMTVFFISNQSIITQALCTLSTEGIVSLLPRNISLPSCPPRTSHHPSITVVAVIDIVEDSLKICTLSWVCAD